MGLVKKGVLPYYLLTKFIKSACWINRRVLLFHFISFSLFIFLLALHSFQVVTGQRALCSTLPLSPQSTFNDGNLFADSQISNSTTSQPLVTPLVTYFSPSTFYNNPNQNSEANIFTAGFRNNLQAEQVVLVTKGSNEQHKLGNLPGLLHQRMGSCLFAR